MTSPGNVGKKREKIGTVFLQDGRELDVYMPLMGDIMPTLLGLKPWDEYLFVLIKSSTGLSKEEFLNLDMIDGTRVLEKLSTAIEAVNKYAMNMTKGRSDG